MAWICKILQNRHMSRGAGRYSPTRAQWSGSASHALCGIVHNGHLCLGMMRFRAARHLDCACGVSAVDVGGISRSAVWIAKRRAAQKPQAFDRTWCHFELCPANSCQMGDEHTQRQNCAMRRAIRTLYIHLVRENTSMSALRSNGIRRTQALVPSSVH